MSQITRVKRGMQSHELLRRWYGLDIPYGNGPRVGRCFSPKGEPGPRLHETCFAEKRLVLKAEHTCCTRRRYE